MPESDVEKLAELYRRRDGAKGTKIVRMIESITTTRHILIINYEELTTANDLFMKNWSLVEPKNKEELNKFLIEYIRHLYNYIASFCSLLDHIDAFHGDADDPQFDKDYHRKFEHLKNNGRVKFIMDLRNYQIHRQLPIVGVELSYMMTPEGIKIGEIAGITKGELSLNKENLLEWDGWTAPSKKYLKGCRRYVYLRELINDCQHIILEFYEWFSDRIKKLYQVELKIYFEIQSEIMRLERMS